MQRLVTTNEAAQILGLSLQGVHYRIKNNQLRSKKENGKTFVYIDERDISTSQENTQTPVQEEKNTKNEHIEEIIAAKNEQIELLKETIHWIKKQHKGEIARLEHNQKKIIKVFDGEIKLLQSAFTEMRNVYALENKNLQSQNNLNVNQDTEEHIIDHEEDEVDESIFPQFITMKDFYQIMKSFDKSDAEIKLIILDRIKKNDKRFIFKKETKEIIIQKDEFIDLA